MRVAKRVRRCLRWSVTWLGHRTEQQHSGGDAPILVSTHAADAQDFDGIGNAVGDFRDRFRAAMRSGIQKRRDKTIFGKSTEKLKALRRQRFVRQQLITG